jgi:hypothetical protein
VYTSTALTGKELGINRSLHHRALARQQRKVPRRIPHPVQIDQILVPPVLTQGHGVGEPMVLAHTIASTGVLGTSDGLGESGIDNVGVELTDGHFGFDEMVRAGRVGKDDGAVGVGRVRGQAEESVERGCTRIVKDGSAC